MSDPLPTDATADAPSGAEREAKIEQLLLTGLDHYFDGQYDQAINIWTRALFLDRGHARARAYIERARSALAERQRESEELLQRGLAAFDRGASTEARRLLEAAITRGAPRDEALSVLDRIQRLDPPAGPARGSETPLDPSPVESTEPKRRRWLGVFAAGAAVVLFAAAAAGIAAGWTPIQITWGRPPLAPSPGSALTSGDADLPLPRRGEQALARARHLAESGRLRDALASLEQVAITDDEKPAADRLRAEIQRQLLAAHHGSETLSPAAGRP